MQAAVLAMSRLDEVIKSQSLRRETGASGKFYGQVTKGAWWMPWQKMAMKDVASCDKPR